MIESLVYLSIGALLAGLLAIALLPALWRRAERLSRQKLTATLPITPNEMAAEKDRIRAAAAVEIRRLELRVEASDQHVQQALKEIGEHVAELQRRKAKIAERDDAIAQLRADLAARHADIEDLQAQIAALLRERDNLATNLNTTRITNQALDMEGSALRQIADQRQSLAASQEKQIAALTSKVAEVQSASSNLKSDLRTRTEEVRASAKALREATARASILERKLKAAEMLSVDSLAQIERLQAERLVQIDEAGAILRARDGERIEREARDAEIARLSVQIADMQSATERARIAHAEITRDLSRTIESLRQEKHQFDSEMSSIRLENARLAGKAAGQRPRAIRARRTPAE